jgi:hypothetical protein
MLLGVSGAEEKAKLSFCAKMKQNAEQFSDFKDGITIA